MRFSIREWRPGHLLASWGAYWAGLAAVSLGPVARAAWRAARLPDGHGTIAVGFENAIFHFKVIEEGVRTITATAPLGTAIAWIVGPPLGLWLLWLALRSPRVESAPAELGRAKADQLPQGSRPAAEWRSPGGEPAGVERERIRTPNP
jgi:hypothetical protein